LHRENINERFSVIVKIPYIAPELNKSNAVHCHKDHFTIKTQPWMWQKLISYFIPLTVEINNIEKAQTTVAMHGNHGCNVIAGGCK